MSCRGNQQQQHMQVLLLQRKADAQRAISELPTQQQKQKDLSKQIARAEADLTGLIIDDKQVCTQQ